MQAVASGNVRLCSLDRSKVVNLEAKNPDVWRSLAALSVMNQMIAMGSAEDLMMRAPHKRLVATLLRMAGMAAWVPRCSPLTTVPISQLELAEASSLSRSSRR